MSRVTWPPFCSPGWIGAYVVGLVCWLAIYQLWGAAVVIAIIAFGLLALASAGEWMHHYPPHEEPETPSSEPPIVTAEADPPIVTAEADHWRCEGCGRAVLYGERVYLYSDDEDGTMVTHLECPTPRAQA